MSKPINYEDADLDVLFRNQCSTSRMGNVNIEPQARPQNATNPRSQVTSFSSNNDSNSDIGNINITIAKPVVAQRVKSGESSSFPSSSHGFKRRVLYQKDSPTNPVILLGSMLKSNTPFSITHKWTIENFERLFNADDKTPTLSVVHSDTFPASDKLKFSIRLIPKYFDETGQIAYVSLFLYLKQYQLENEAISVYYNFSIINSKWEKVLHKDETHDFKQENSHGWDKLIRLDHLLDRSKGFLQNGNLAILCSANIFANNLSSVTDSTLKKISSESRFNCDLKVNQVNRLWEIEQFSAFFYRTNVSIDKYFCVQSENFSAKNTNKYYLRLWPKGIDEQSDGFVSLFLHCENFAQIDYAQYRLSILDRSGEFFHFGEGKIEFLRKQESTAHLSQGSTKFLPIDSIFDPKNGLLPGDKLTIYCEIEEVIKSAQPSSSSRYTTQRSVYDQIDERDARLFSRPILELDKFAHIGIQPDFRFLPTPELLSRGDVFFTVQGQVFPAKRLTLSAKSVVFKALFEQTRAYGYKISKIDPDVFKLMLDFVNSDNLNAIQLIGQQNMSQLLQFAHKFELHDHKERCEQALIDTPKCSDNALDLLILAQGCQAGDLKESLIDFIANQCPLICQSDAFVQLARSDPTLFMELNARIIENDSKAS